MFSITLQKYKYLNEMKNNLFSCYIVLQVGGGGSINLIYMCLSQGISISNMKNVSSLDGK